MKFLILLSFITLNSFAADCFFNVKSVTPVWKGAVKQKFEFLLNGKSEIAYKDRKTEIKGESQQVSSKFYCDCGEKEKCSAQLADYVKKIACKTPPKGDLSLGMIDSTNWDVDAINVKKGVVAPNVTYVLSVVEFIKDTKSLGLGHHEIYCLQ